jgi:hypothetical protein
LDDFVIGVVNDFVFFRIWVFRRCDVHVSIITSRVSAWRQSGALDFYAMRAYLSRVTILLSRVLTRVGAREACVLSRAVTIVLSRVSTPALERWARAFARTPYPD